MNRLPYFSGHYNLRTHPAYTIHPTMVLSLFHSSHSAVLLCAVPGPSVPRRPLPSQHSLLCTLFLPGFYVKIHILYVSHQALLGGRLYIEIEGTYLEPWTIPHHRPTLKIFGGTPFTTSLIVHPVSQDENYAEDHAC